MILKGLFWKPGINGLGVKIFKYTPKLPYSKLFDNAAKMHDEMYNLQGSENSRFIKDKYFLLLCLCVCKNQL